MDNSRAVKEVSIYTQTNDNYVLSNLIQYDNNTILSRPNQIHLIQSNLNQIQS